MKNAFLKDILRDLKKSAGRFAGMFAIVAIGVFMYAGLGSTGVLMRNVGNAFYDERRFFDIHVVSTYGLNDGDMEALRQVDGVESVTGAYNLDAFIVQGAAQVNTKLHSLSIDGSMFRQVNQPEITSGRYPERFDEAVVEENILALLNIRVGDSIRLASGRSADLRTRLRTDSFRVVGTVSSPLYFHRQRGSSSIGSGQADAFLLLPEESFLQSVYSEAYITVTGAAELYTYDDEYEDLIDTVTDRIALVAEVRESKRKIEATRRAWEGIAAAEEQLGKAEAEAAHGLAEAGRELASGESALAAGRMELAQAEGELADSYLLLDTQRLELENSLAELETMLAAMRGTESGLRDQRSSLQQSLRELQSSHEELLRQKWLALGASSLLGSGLTSLQDALLEVDAQLAELELGIESLEARKSELLERFNASTDDGEQETILAELETVDEQLLALYLRREELTANRRELERRLGELVTDEEELGQSFQLLRASRRYWTGKMLQAEEGRHQLDLSLVTVQDLIEALEQQKAELESGFTELEFIELELDTASQSLAASRQEASGSRFDLRDAAAALALEEGAAAKEIEAARATIRESRDALSELSDPKWYTLGRRTNAGFGGFAGESEQVSDIGSFLPLLFFLVAALVSLTTMTRLVEEQRTGMGTYKALGYSGGRILSKYLLYAIVPSGLGALFGGILGLAYFPRIIMEGAFAVMYEIPPYKAELNLPYLLAGFLLAVLSTAVPTLITCRGELREVPASLMRPRAPRIGGKTPLEYLTFLWRRLSFLYKVTFRNIFRYKKRLFMTLVGVGGSTALLLTGFGMNDASGGIVDRQYTDLYRYDLSVSFVDDVTQSTIQSTRKVIATSPATAGNILLREEMVELHNGNGDTEDAVMMVANSADLEGYVILRDRITGEPLTLPDSGALLSEWAARSLGLAPGDRLVIRDADDEEFTVEIAATCEAYLGNAVYLSPECYRAAAGNAPKDNVIYAVQAAGSTTGELEALSQVLLDRGGVSAVANMVVQAQTYRDMLGAMKAVIVLIIAIAALLAFVVLLNLTNINLAERMREIATIEVLGFRDRETSAYIYRENFVVTFIAALIGIGLGVPLHSFLCFSIEGDGMMMPREIAPLSFLLSVAMTMVFAVLVALATSGRLRKINMIEALKSAE